MNKAINLILPRPLNPSIVGDAFRVFNIIPGAGILPHKIDPFLMLDFNAQFDFSPSEKVRGTNVHPHKGFETVTIVYQGSIAHQDSAGNVGIINPGDVQWMTAGRGILHKEYLEEKYSRKGGPFEMVQLWINLPKKCKAISPGYQNLKGDQLCKVILSNNNGDVNIIAGKFHNVTGPAHTQSPVNLFDIRLQKAGEVEFMIPESHNTALLLIKGKVEVNESKVKEHSIALFKCEGTDIAIRAVHQSVILVLSGEPINEPVVSYGPFVMNTQEEISEAIEEFQSGKFGTLE